MVRAVEEWSSSTRAPLLLVVHAHHIGSRDYHHQLSYLECQAIASSNHSETATALFLVQRMGARHARIRHSVACAFIWMVKMGWLAASIWRNMSAARVMAKRSVPHGAVRLHTPIRCLPLPT